MRMRGPTARSSLLFPADSRRGPPLPRKDPDPAAKPVVLSLGRVGNVGGMDDQLARSAEELATTLTPVDLDHTLGRITAAAVEALPDVDYASTTVRHADGSLETVAPTDPALCDLDAVQYTLEEGPCFDAATTTG